MRIDRVKLAAELVRQDMTITDLSQKSGVSRMTISSIKSGKSCSEDTARKIADALEIPIDDLV